MAVQTEVTLQNIGYVSDLGPHMKVAGAWFEKIGFVLFFAQQRKSDMGHIWAKKSDLGHFSLQCELSLCVKPMYCFVCVFPHVLSDPVSSFCDYLIWFRCVSIIPRLV